MTDTAFKPCDQDTENLAKGWAVVPLGDCVEILDHMRVPVNSEERKGRVGSIPYYGATGQVGWIDDFLFDEELLLLGEDGAPFLDKTKPISYLINGKTWVNNHAHVLRARSDRTSNRFMKYALDAQDFHGFVNGSTRLKLTQGAMQSMPVRLPPLAEQHRIVKKVEALLARVNAARERLAKVSVILKRFRQAVLAAACSGRLTEEWRQTNCLPSALSHLATINAQRKRVRVPRSHTTSVEPVIDASLPDLPQTWAWVKFGDVIGELRNGVSPRPSLTPPGIPNLRISAVRSGVVNLEDHRFLRDAREYVGTYSLRDNDLLFTRYNGSLDLLGVCGMVRGLGKRTLLYPDKLMRVRFDHEELLPAYVELFFSAPDSRRRMTEEAKSSAGQQGISGHNVKEQVFAFPPIEEQAAIVSRVGVYFRIAEAAERRVATATARADKLTQAILAKAFRGELVPTEAELARQDGRDYEPASALLERIRAERAAAESGGEGAKPRHTRGRTKRVRRGKATSSGR